MSTIFTASFSNFDSAEPPLFKAGRRHILAESTTESRKGNSMTRRLAVVLAIALATPLAPAQAQTELSAYADKNGYVNVQKLTCGQLAGTFQEDANFLGIWYSGWYNGLGKKSSVNLPRVKEGIHELIVYCKANQGSTIINAIDVLLKTEKAHRPK